jgi:hypothetical protein
MRIALHKKLNDKVHTQEPFVGDYNVRLHDLNVGVTNCNVPPRMQDVEVLK